MRFERTGEEGVFSLTRSGEQCDWPQRPRLPQLWLRAHRRRESHPLVRASPTRCEHLPIDGVGDHPMSRVVGMKMVPMVVGSQVLCRMIRVMGSGILVHNPIAAAAPATNKAVDLLPLLLFRGRPRSRSLKGGQRRTDKAYLPLMRPRNQSLQS